MVPPLVGVAVNLTEVPAQIAPDGTAAIDTLAVSDGLTVMAIPFEVEGDPVTQDVKFEVISTLITSPFSSVVEVYSFPVANGIVLPPFFHI